MTPDFYLDLELFLERLRELLRLRLRELLRLRLRELLRLRLRLLERSSITKANQTINAIVEIALEIFPNIKAGTIVRAHPGS